VNIEASVTRYCKSSLTPVYPIFPEHTYTYSTGHRPDGTGVISGGNFNADVIVNDNDDTVGLLDPTTSTFVIIANGGNAR
jgi:hypothetical protein